MSANISIRSRTCFSSLTPSARFRFETGCGVSDSKFAFSHSLGFQCDDFEVSILNKVFLG